MKLPSFKRNQGNAPKKPKGPMTKARKRQYFIAATVAAAIGGASFFGAWKTKKNEEERTAQETQVQAKQPKVITTDLNQPTQILDGPAITQRTIGADMDTQEQRLSQLELMMRDMQKGNALNESKNAIPGADRSLPPPPANMLPVPTAKGPNGLGAAPTESKIETIRFDGGNSNVPGINPVTGLPTKPGTTVGILQPGDSGTTAYIKGIRPNIVVTEDGGDVTVIRRNQSQAMNSSGKFRAQKSYVPTGTFFRAVLLGGLDAPTGGESSTANPHPVLMQVTQMAQLPNSFRSNFKKCFVTGTGYGDLSSERAMIRTEQLSCVGVDGRAIDIPIKGYIAGDDGKTGVLGRLVSKQGAAIKNAMIAGLLGGIGQGFSSAANITSNNGLGTVSSVSTGKQVQNALGTGVGNAFDRLANYYVKLADKVFPVIEVNAGRQVDIVLLKGFQIDPDGDDK